MKSFRFIFINLLIIFIDLFLYHHTAQAVYMSPSCQNIIKNQSEQNYSPDIIDMCLITGYIGDSEGKPTYQVYENESQTSHIKTSTKIIDVNIPEHATCTSHSPCPKGRIRLNNGQTKTVKGTCHLNKDQPNQPGTCTYEDTVELKHQIRGLDFARNPIYDPLVTNIANPNLLISEQLKKLLTPQDKLRYSLALVLKKTPKSSQKTSQYLGAIDPQTEFSCFQTDQNPEGLTYTFKQLKDLIPDQVKQLYLLSDKPNYQAIFSIYWQDLQHKQLWAQLIACLPLSPSAAPPPSSKSNNPGFSYMSLGVNLGFGKPTKSKFDLYPADSHAGTYFGSLVWLLASLPAQEQDRFKDQLAKTNPLVLYFWPDKPLISKQRFLKAHPHPIHNAYPLGEYISTVINNPNSTNKHLVLPKTPNPDNIEQANAVATEGFPANMDRLVAQVLAAIGIKIEKHFITIPSLNQQVLDAILSNQLKIELPPQEQQLISQDKNHPIALKGSTYAGGLEHLHLYQSRNFSVIMPYSFKEYCPANAHINEYVSGLCNPQIAPPTYNPFLSPEQ